MWIPPGSPLQGSDDVAPVEPSAAAPKQTAATTASGQALEDSGTLESSAPADPPLAVVLGNLAALSILAVLIGCWVGYFTDLLPVMVTWLSLGGVLGVAGLVVALLPKTFKERIQQLFLARVLGAPSTWRAVATAFLAALLAASFFGSVRVVFRPGLEKGGLNLEPTLQESPSDTTGETEQATLLPNGIVCKYLRYAPWTGRTYRIRLRPDGGLPSRTVVLRPFSRADIAVPDDFQARRRILLRPAPSVANTVYANPTYTLQMEIDDRAFKSIPGYNGQVVWVGSDAEEVPPDFLEGWGKFELNYGVIDLWKKPLNWSEKVTKDSVVKAKLLTEEGTDWAFGQTATGPNSTSQLLEEVILDVP